MSSYAGGLLVSTSYLLYFFVQVPIYIFLFLLYRDKFRDFFLRFTPDSELKWKKEIEGVVRGYISGLLIVVFIAGVLNSIGLLLLDIDHAIFFGFLSGTLTMIPYVGITIGAALPTILALITKDSIWYAVGVVAVHGVVQFLEGNFISPQVTGSKISINALAAILALLLGGKLWGNTGNDSGCARHRHHQNPNDLLQITKSLCDFAGGQACTHTSCARRQRAPCLT